MAEETLQIDLVPTSQPSQHPNFYFTGSGSPSAWSKLSWSIPVNLRGDFLIYLKYMAVDINGAGYTSTAPNWITLDSPQLNLKYGGGAVGLKPCYFISASGNTGGLFGNVITNPIKFETTINGYIDIEILGGLEGNASIDAFNKAVLQFSVFKNDNTDRDMVPNFMKFSNQ